MYNCLMRLKIMLIGEDPFQVAVVEEVVKEFGHDVITVSAFSEAIEMAEIHRKRMTPFDVIFINYPFPGVDVDQLSLGLKEVDPKNTIIALSEDNSVEARLKLVRCQGFDGFINKAADVSYVRRYLDMAMSAKKNRLGGERSAFFPDTGKSPD